METNQTQGIPAKEDLHTEFKEALSGLPGNLCDTLCAFLNTDGGTLYLGIGDKGEVLGLEPEQIERYAKDIASISNNPQKIDPPYLLFPQAESIGDKRILVVQVPLSSQLHRHKGEIYLRSDEGDYRVKGSHQLAGLLNRKLGIFTEQTPMPKFSLKDLRPDLFERARTLMRRRSQNHPWLDLDMDALLRTAGLYTPADPPSRTLTLAEVAATGHDTMQVTPEDTPEDTGAESKTHPSMQVTVQDTMQVTVHVDDLLKIFSGTHTRQDLQEIVGLANRDYFRLAYLQPALEAGLIERTLPDKPNSRLQKYRLTEKGRQMAERVNQQPENAP